MADSISALNRSCNVGSADCANFCDLSDTSNFFSRDTLKGKTKPNKVTWGMWAFAPLLGTAAALVAGADPWATARIFFAGFFPLIIFCASFINKKSYWKISLFDALCGGFSLIALVIWILLDSPRYAILFLAIADGFALTPTLLKAWKFPETESGLAYVFGLSSVLLVIPAIPVWNIENAAFQIYLFFANALLVFAVYRRKYFFNN